MWDTEVDEGYGFTIAVDSEDNVYHAAYTPNPTLIKHSPVDGSIIWQKQIILGTPGTTYMGASDLAISPDNSIYVTGYYYANEINDSIEIAVVKFDSAGNTVWQRSFGTPSDEYFYWYWGVNNIAVTDDFYSVTGYTYAPTSDYIETFITNLSADGSGVGQYGPFIYEVSNFIVEDSAFTTSAGALIVDTVMLEVACALLSLPPTTK